MRYVYKDINSADAINAQQRLNESAKGRYDLVSVRRFLRQVYNGRCAYCDNTVGDTSTFHIDHFYPKGCGMGYSDDKYVKNLCNLHFTCPACNQTKGRVNPSKIFTPNYRLDGDEWIEIEPLTITNSLEYRGYYIYTINSAGAETNMANNTIDEFNLNNQNKKKQSRSFLVESRRRVYLSIGSLLNAAYQLLNLWNDDCKKGKLLAPSVTIVMRLIYNSMQPTAPFSEMVIQNYAEDYLKLLKIWQILRDK